MRSCTANAYAKVNLTLDILGRRADGYHDLRMVMQTISLCDTVCVQECADGFSLRTTGDFIPAGKKTLEEQAAEAFFQYVGLPVPGLAVELIKRTPAYAGLGGGSADVAALLRVLRDWYCPQLSGAELEKIGFQIGSDMPFCVRGGTALAEGRGELLTDLPSLPECWFVLCKPDFGIPTPELFKRADACQLKIRPDTDGMLTTLQQGDLRGVASKLCNVFEEVLPQEYSEVFKIKERLLAAGALNAAMSGSGPTVFGIFEKKADALSAEEVLKQTYSQTFLASPVKRIR